MDLHIDETFYLNHESGKCLGGTIEEILHKVEGKHTT